MSKNTQGGVMKVKGSRRLVARLGLALAVAAIAAPSAQAVTMNAMNESGGGVRLYADDLRAPVSQFTLPASNVRTDAASIQPSMPGANVLTDAASSRPVSIPVSFPASNVQTDAASSRPVSNPVSFASNVQTDAASSRPDSVPVAFPGSDVHTDPA